MLGALLGATGALVGAPWGRGSVLTVGVVALAYAAREVFRVPVPIPELRRQVPEWWRGAFGPRLAAFLYGFALGPGFFTHLRHGTFVVAAAAAVALGDPLLGVVMLAPFGLARAIAVAFASASRTEPALAATGERLERLGSGQVPRTANAVALLALAAATAFVAASGGESPSWLWPLILASTFTWAAAGKVVAWPRWREALRAYALPRWIAGPAEIAVPIVEASIAVLLFAGSTRIGPVLALGLLAAFSVALARAPRAADGRLPCGCFGRRARRSIRWLLTRNAALGIVAGVSYVTGGRIPLPSLPDSGETFPAFLALAGVALTAWLVFWALRLANPRAFRQ
jgi:hypothetical protein